MQHTVKKTIFYMAAAGFILLLLFTGIQYRNRDRIQRQLSDKVLRFHVMANSDTKEDQELKLKVRDAVGGMLGEKMKAAGSRESCESILLEELPAIREKAREVVASEGYNYPVEAYIKDVDFPVKSYGAYTLPAGNYKALELVIGAGNGHNWWCIMYPNMCFSGSVYETAGEEADEALCEVLSEEEYKTVLETGNYKVQFKYLKFLNALCE